MGSHEKFMGEALAAARAGVESGQTPFGACIVKDGQVVVCAHNVVWATCDITAHAEVNAIRQACRKLGTIDLTGCVIYSTTEPCPMCFSAIHWARIEKIYYGADIKDAQEVGFNEITICNRDMKESGGSQVEVQGGILAGECRMLYKEWVRRYDKKTY